jgi:hypothetical protein
MWTTLLILGITATDPDSAFPDWHIRPAVEAVPKPPVWQMPNSTGDGEWIVVTEHLALRRDSLMSVDVVPHPFLTMLLWPIDHAVRPSVGLVIKPMRAAIRYVEATDLVDRGQNFVHPTGRESLMLYPTAVLDGTIGSRWGATFVDRDFFCPGWRLQAGGALTVAADGNFSASTQTPSFGPFAQRIRLGGSYALNREVALHIPDYAPVWDTKVAGATSERRIIGETSISTPGPIKGSWWDVAGQLAYRSTSAPRRFDAEFGDLSGIAWFANGDRIVPNGDRGIQGVELDRTVTLTMEWADQENRGAPTFGGRITSKMWYTFADGGGDVAGFDVNATRYFLLGSERYVYKKGDLEPYLDLDPLRIIKMLDPSTLRQRLTQRKILVFYARLARIWETEGEHHPASYFLFPGLGGDAPARGYPGRYLVGKALIGGAVEYRWPIWKYIDGSSFAELAWAAPDWWEATPKRLAPSIGGGMRVRTQSMFLFRIQAAFGLASPQLIATTDAEF